MADQDVEIRDAAANALKEFDRSQGLHVESLSWDYGAQADAVLSLLEQVGWYRSDDHFLSLLYNDTRHDTSKHRPVFALRSKKGTPHA